MIIAGLNCQITVTIETWPPSSIVPKPPQFSQLDIKVSSCIMPKQGEEVKVKCLLIRGRKGRKGGRSWVRGRVGWTEWSCTRSPWQLQYEKWLEGLCDTGFYWNKYTSDMPAVPFLISLVRECRYIIQCVCVLVCVCLCVCVCVCLSLCPGTMSCSSSLTPVRAPPCTRGSTLQTSWLWPAVKLERTPCRWVAYPQTKEMN